MAISIVAKRTPSLTVADRSEEIATLARAMLAAAQSELTMDEGSNAAFRVIARLADECHAAAIEQLDADIKASYARA